MSKKFTEQKSLTKMSDTKTTRFKIFAVTFHGTNLESMEKEIVNEIEIHSSKKIYAVTVKDTEREKVYQQIKDDLEKFRNDFVDGDKSLQSSLLEDDLRTHWNKEVEPQLIEIIPRKLTKTDLKVMNLEIQSKQIEFCDYFVIIFGGLSSQTITDLITNKHPLQAIIHFIPCAKANLKINFPELYTNIDFLRKSSHSKNVGIFIESLIPTSEYLDEETPSQQIYDQFTWYLYDIEMLAQQFIAYQSDFFEINDTIPESEEQLLLWSKFIQAESEKDAISDDAAVAVYLDNLCRTIENRTNFDRRDSFSYQVPFFDNDYGKTIIEEANNLLETALATQISLPIYSRLADMVVNAQTNPSCPKNIESEVQLPLYYEILSWEGFAQSLEARKASYDECCRVDMTEKYKLFVLRRVLNKIVQVDRKLRLPTQLAFRDFCSFLAPALVKLHQKYHKTYSNRSENQPKFYGIAFDGTLHELRVSERVFRFEDGYINCSVEKWINRNQMLTTKIHISNCLIFNHRWEDFMSNYSRVRILTNKNVALNVDIKEDWHSKNISIHWPNGCQIKYIQGNGSNALEQSYNRKGDIEVKRLYTPQGLVLRFLIDDCIEVLTPNGIVYMLYSETFVNENLNYFQSELTEVDFDLSSDVEFVKNLRKYGVKCQYFDVTKLDGKKFKIWNDGNSIKEETTLMVYEWSDYHLNEKYADRDDGLKMIWKSCGLHCYYPCGTVIKTTVTEERIEEDFVSLSKSTENFLRNINPTLVEKIANKAKDTFIAYNLNYLMQHKNYASVSVFGEDKMVIQSPDELKLILKEENLILIDIGEILSFRIVAGVCTIYSGTSIPEDKQKSIRLNLFPDVREILTFQNKFTFLRMFSNGKMKLIEEKEKLIPYEEKKIFLSKVYNFGLEFMSEQMYRNVVDHINGNNYIYNSACKTVIMQPIFPIDTQFSMSISIFEKDLYKFKAMNQKLPEADLREPAEPDLTARVIHKLNAAPKDLCEFIGSIHYNEATLENQVKEALEYIFHKKVKSKNLSKWNSKIKTVKKDLEVKKQRVKLYRIMLNRNSFPKYHDFEDCQRDIKQMNTNKLKELTKN